MTEFKRSRILKGSTIKTKTGLGNLYITVNEDENNKPVEVFAIVGKSGKSITAKSEAIGRLVTLNLQSGVDVNKIIEQLKGIGGEHPQADGNDLLLSIPDAIAQILEELYIKKESNYNA